MFILPFPLVILGKEEIMVEQLMISLQLLPIDKVAKVLDHHLLNEVDVGDGQHRVEAKVDPVDGAVLLPQANLGHFRSIAENGEEVAHAEEGRPGAGDAPVAPVGVLLFDASK